MQRHHPVTADFALADSAARRGGFTLVEVIVVILIIALLIGLLLPALMGGRTAATVAQAQTEISQLETAIAAFEAKYGVKPPSRFVIPPSADSSGQSQAIARRVWSQIQGNGGITAPNSVSTAAASSGSVTLNGSECLVFFLGGLIQAQDDNFVMLGFSKNPRLPFNSDGTREGPFYEFPVGRLRDTDGNGFPELMDPFETDSPFVYLSPSGYQPQNNNDPNNAVIHSGSRIAQAYLQAASKFWKPKDYQIISAGIDGQFGTGGLLTNLSQADQDNLTNFASGQLKSE